MKHHDHDGHGHGPVMCDRDMDGSFKISRQVVVVVVVKQGLCVT